MAQSPSPGGPSSARGKLLADVAGTPLAPARTSGRAIARERLLAQLLDARRRRCIVVTGPAGCGKTMLLASWRQALVPLGFDVAWLSLAAEDNELARFLDALVATIAEVDPSLVRDAALLGFDHADTDAVERLAIALVRRIAAHPRDLVLVLDDLHHATRSDIHEALQWLLDFAPPNLHLALASRGGIRLSLDRLHSQGQVMELRPRELRFSLAETEQFLKPRVGDLDPRTVRSLHELTDGWAAGLQLLTVDWHRKKPTPELHAPSSGDPFAGAPMRDARAFARYFEQEVLSTLSAVELDALVCMAPSSRFCASLCAALQGEPDAVAQAVTLLARLERDNLFVVPVEGQNPEAWYRVHPLLRETLLSRFAALDESRQRDVHARAWAWFRDRGLLDEAVRHAVQAGEASQAAALVEQCAVSLFVRGERRTLISLLRQLPLDQIERSFTLRTWMARSQIYTREFDACARSLERMERDLPADDALNRFRVAMLRATMAVQRDDADAALALLPQLLDAPAGLDPIAAGGRNNLLSWLYMHQGQYEKARQVQLDSPALLIDGVPLSSSAAGSLQGRCLMGLSYALEGQMTQAERIYRAVATEAERGGKACADTYYLAIALLGDVLYERNDAQGARALLESRVDVLERVTIPDAVLRVHRLLSAAHWQAGHRLESFAYLERLEDYAVRQGLDRLLAYSLADQMHRRLQLGETMAAEDELVRLDALDAKHPGATQQSTRSEIGEIAERSRIALAMAQGNLEGAASRLNVLIARCEARGHQRVAAMLLVKSAAVDVRRGHASAAHEKLLEALRRGHRLGLLRSLLDADPSARSMFSELARTDVLDPVLAFYVERLQSTHARVPDTAAGDAGASPAAGGRVTAASDIDAFSEREIEVLRLLAQAMPNKKIARALDLSPETVKWYLSRIYAKLQVSGRDEAVARVRDLALGG
jgi:LuxR family maltose regulon positive regulatory protein